MVLWLQSWGRKVVMMVYYGAHFSWDSGSLIKTLLFHIKGHFTAPDMIRPGTYTSSATRDLRSAANQLTPVQFILPHKYNCSRLISDIFNELSLTGFIFNLTIFVIKENPIPLANWINVLVLFLHYEQQLVEIIFERFSSILKVTIFILQSKSFSLR